MRETREQWHERVVRWRASRMTAGEFAARHGVSANTLRHWAWKLGRERETRALSGVPSMIEVHARPVADDRFEIELGGRCIRVPASFDSDALRRLLAVLAEGS